MNPRRTMVRNVKIMIALTLLAWATQTLFHQWGFGQEIQAADASPGVTDAIPAAEKFVPQSHLITGAGTLELRAQATIYGADIHLKQLCRWSDADAPVFAQVSDLVIARFDGAKALKPVSLDDIRQMLHDAGVNLAVIRFCGATTCKVTRSDPSSGDREALQQCIDEKQAATAPSSASSTSPLTSVPAAVPVLPDASSAAFHSLRDRLLIDLSQRLNLPVDQLEVNFDSKDANLLNLSEPNFHFEVRAKRVRDLGDVGWDTAIITVGGQQQVAVTGHARAWQNQLVVTRPVSYKQVLQDQDVAERRVLIEHLPDAVVLDKSQAIGQQAARDLQPGMVMTARLVEAVPLARSGQYVTVTLNQGSVQIKTVAKALEPGSFGQTIKVKNEATRDTFEVTLIGPQAATMGTASETGLMARGN